jgi:hypothetical protein
MLHRGSQPLFEFVSYRRTSQLFYLYQCSRLSDHKHLLLYYFNSFKKRF